MPRTIDDLDVSGLTLSVTYEGGPKRGVSVLSARFGPYPLEITAECEGRLIEALIPHLETELAHDREDSLASQRESTR